MSVSKIDGSNRESFFIVKFQQFCRKIRRKNFSEGTKFGFYSEKKERWVLFEKKFIFFSKSVKVASKFVIEHVSYDFFFIKAYFLPPELSVFAEIRKTLFLEKLSKFAGDVYRESAFNLLKCNFSKTSPW